MKEVALLIKGVKSPRKKNGFSANFALLAGFFCYWRYHPNPSRDALSPVYGILKKTFYGFLGNPLQYQYLHNSVDF